MGEDVATRRTDGHRPAGPAARPGDRTPRRPPPPDLWTRGVRRRRASQATTAALVAVLVLILGVGGWTWHAHGADPARGSPRRPAPAGPLLLPPSPWLRTFDGPPGALVTVLPAEQKTMLHTRQGLVGVTAVDGRYGFLRPAADAVAGRQCDQPVRAGAGRRRPRLLAVRLPDGQSQHGPERQDDHRGRRRTTP